MAVLALSARARPAHICRLPRTTPPPSARSGRSRPTPRARGPAVRLFGEPRLGRRHLGMRASKSALQERGWSSPGGLILALAIVGLFCSVYPRRLRVGLAVGIGGRARSWPLDWGSTIAGYPIRLLYDYAPGWNGVRVPGAHLHARDALLRAAGGRRRGAAALARARTWLAARPGRPRRAVLVGAPARARGAAGDRDPWAKERATSGTPWCRSPRRPRRASRAR